MKILPNIFSKKRMNNTVMSPKTIQLEADYLVIGAGASGMAFVDELIHHTSELSVIVVDKQSKPGGHWNNAYSFVTLHQPASFYGVNSKPLGKHGKDLATLSEIDAYYETVMKELEATGRVRFFPQCVYTGNGVFKSLLVRNLEYKVIVARKIVDATYVSPIIPSTHTPDFQVSDSTNFIPVNGLSTLTSAWDQYLIIGGGKTSLDAVIYLLDKSVDPDDITWIIPNDSWFFNRNEFFPETTWVDGNIKLLDCLPNRTCINELFKEWEKVGIVFRLDSEQPDPTKFTGATISEKELQKVQRVKNIVRKGRISHIKPDRIEFVNGTTLSTTNTTLHVDCSANGSSRFTPTKIFDGPKITLQDVRAVQTAYSAAVLAAIECLLPDEASENKKNDLLKAIPRFQSPADVLPCLLQDIFNEFGIISTLGAEWIRNSRLHPLHHAPITLYEKFLKYGKENGGAIVQSLTQLINETFNEERKMNCL